MIRDTWSNKKRYNVLLFLKTLPPTTPRVRSLVCTKCKEPVYARHQDFRYIRVAASSPCHISFSREFFYKRFSSFVLLKFYKICLLVPLYLSSFFISCFSHHFETSKWSHRWLYVNTTNYLFNFYLENKNVLYSLYKWLFDLR